MLVHTLPPHKVLAPVVRYTTALMSGRHKHALLSPPDGDITIERVIGLNNGTAVDALVTVRGARLLMHSCTRAAAAVQLLTCHCAGARWWCLRCRRWATLSSTSSLARCMSM